MRNLNCFKFLTFSGYVSQNSRTATVSLVSHSSYVFKGSLRENMTMAKIDATDEQIYACLEQVNLAQFVRDNDVKNDPENIDDFFNSWVYLGEVFRLQAKGAYWTVGTENPKNLNYGLEYLTGYNTIGSEFIPLLILNNFTLSLPDRLNNNFFYELVLKRLNPKPRNLDHLLTEEE